MTEGEIKYIGGCLCGALRYEAAGAPLYMGHCYCSDCRKASGSGFISYIGFSRDALIITGQAHEYRSEARSGGESVRSSCPVCAGLVFGGEIGKSDMFTIYAGSLDTPSMFTPTTAIFTRGRPSWAIIPPGLTIFEDGPA